MIKIINLKRRPEKKKNMEKFIEKYDLSNVEFFEAIDDSTFEKLTDKQKAIFRDDRFNRWEYPNWRKGSMRGFPIGVVGCTLSHITLWEKLIEDEKHNFYVIFEDDIDFVKKENLKKFYEAVSLFENKIPDINVLFLGINDPEKQIKNKNIQENNDQILEISNYGSWWAPGSWGYIINKKAAKHIINFIKKHGMEKQPIDYIYKNSKLVHHFIYPCLIKTTTEISDIWH